MPKSFVNLQSWLTNLKNGVTTDGPNLGQSPGQVTTDTNLIDSILKPVTVAIDAQTAEREASGAARSTIAANRQALRDMINRYKNSVGWNDGMEAGWQVGVTTPDYDMSTLSPRIKARAVPGRIEITGRKPGFDSVNIQMRMDGAADWTTIGTKINHFPFFDTTAPQAAGKPETREYRALGMLGDAQVGQPSDIVTAIWSD